MKKIVKGAAWAMLLSLLLLAAMGMPTVSAEFRETDEEYEVDVSATWASTAPELANTTFNDMFTYESNISYTNWWFEPTSPHKDGLIWLAFANDAHYLYVFADVTPDNTSDDDDHMAIYVDINEDEEWDDDEPFYDIAGNMSADNANHTSEMPFVWYKGFEKTDQASDYRHRTWAFAIPLSGIEASPGDIINIYANGNFTSEWQFPKANVDDGSFPTDIITSEVTLAESPVVVTSEAASTQYKNDAAWMGGVAMFIWALFLMLGGSDMDSWLSKRLIDGQKLKAYIVLYGAPLLITLLTVTQTLWNWVAML